MIAAIYHLCWREKSFCSFFKDFQLPLNLVTWFRYDLPSCSRQMLPNLWTHSFVNSSNCHFWVHCLFSKFSNILRPVFSDFKEEQQKSFSHERLEPEKWTRETRASTTTSKKRQTVRWENIWIEIVCFMCVFVVFAVIWLIEFQCVLLRFFLSHTQHPMRTNVVYRNKKFMGILFTQKNGSFAFSESLGFRAALIFSWWTHFGTARKVASEATERRVVFNVALGTKQQKNERQTSEKIFEFNFQGCWSLCYDVVKRFFSQIVSCCERLNNKETNPSGNRLITQSRIAEENLQHLFRTNIKSNFFSSNFYELFVLLFGSREVEMSCVGSWYGMMRWIEKKTGLSMDFFRSDIIFCKYFELLKAF